MQQLSVRIVEELRTAKVGCIGLCRVVVNLFYQMDGEMNRKRKREGNLINDCVASPFCTPWLSSR